MKAFLLGFVVSTTATVMAEVLCVTTRLGVDITVPGAQQNMRPCGQHVQALFTGHDDANRIYSQMLERHPDNPGYSMLPPPRSTSSSSSPMEQLPIPLSIHVGGSHEHFDTSGGDVYTLLREEAVAHFLNFHKNNVTTGRALVLPGLQESEEVEYEGTSYLWIPYFFKAYNGLMTLPILGFVTTFKIMV
ncbi:hypothetical protein GIB67_036079 [Kingdonia uniflora]|uniref:Uncharacterized protein n=1 Tax=Kingdonia uniflora TaxID=39325 RepID=A0A7J7N8Q3_9MAGN|nr:hypothetical protein GIB67_036079 [Kingdonia uniflora]